jgi:hypothetical protein
MTEKCLETETTRPPILLGPMFLSITRSRSFVHSLCSHCDREHFKESG